MTNNARSPFNLLFLLSPYPSPPPPPPTPPTVADVVKSLSSSAPVDGDQWKTLQLYIRKLYSVGDDMLFVGKGLDKVKKAEAEKVRGGGKGGKGGEKERDNFMPMCRFDSNTSPFGLHFTIR